MDLLSTQYRNLYQPNHISPVSATSDLIKYKIFSFNITGNYGGSSRAGHRLFVVVAVKLASHRVVSWKVLIELIAYKLQLVDEHITILCIFILSWIKFCLNQRYWRGQRSRKVGKWGKLYNYNTDLLSLSPERCSCFCFRCLFCICCCCRGSHQSKCKSFLMFY